MSIPQSKQIAAKLLEEAALGEPLYREQGKLFLKFDQIVFDPYPSPHLVYYWRGKESIRQPLPNHNPYYPLSISGIDGKAEITLSAD